MRVKVTNPIAIPAIIDSIGNPGIPPPVTVAVLVVELVLVIEVTVRNVDTADVVIRLVDVVTVQTSVDVEVVVKRPPKGAKRSIVANGFVATPPPERSGLEPTIQPLLGEV